jgi:2-methylisocitrate lyase-like PEP mutase family enzyme
MVDIFRKLHYRNESLFLPNVWDVNSACIFEASGTDPFA